MSTKATKTIDDLGFETYSIYEERRKSFDSELLFESKSVASQMTYDIFEPLLVSEFNVSFDMTTRAAPWGMMPPPDNYNNQQGRLYTYQLAPKLGPDELIEMQMNRIEGEKKQKMKKLGKKEGKEASQDVKEIEKEATILLSLMSEVNTLNNLMRQIHAERFRFGKG